MALVTPTPARTRRNVELALLVLAVGIALAAYAYLGLVTDGALPGDMVTYGGLLAVLTGAVHVVLRLKARYADPVILPIATTINALGLVMIHRLDLAEKREIADSLALKQMTWTGLGILACGIVLWFVRDHRSLARYTYTAMASGLVLLLLPVLPLIGHEVNGARIWIKEPITGMTFQPGELAKITLAVFFAGYLVTARDSLSLVGRKFLFLQLPRARDLGPILLAWGASLLVLMLERDLGSSLLFFGLFIALLYVATERTSWIVIGLLLFSAGAFLAWTIFSHVQVRVAIWLHPFDNTDRAYQLIQGLYGMASGGLLGTGLGQGRPDIVPFAESDFIAASFGEELGLTGMFAMLLLYALLVERGLRTAIGVRDGFGKLFAAGLAFSMALQVFVVVGGVTRVIPLTGLTMPFLAYGGSSLLSNWIIVGLLLRISDAARRPSPDTSALNLPPAPAPAPAPAPTPAPTPAPADGGAIA